MFGDLRQYIRNEFHFHCTAMILLRAYVNIAMKTVTPDQRSQVFNALHQYARTSLRELDRRTTAKGSQSTKKSSRLFPDAGEEDRHRKATECFDSINQITA